jgi:hypothetical protein
VLVSHGDGFLGSRSGNTSGRLKTEESDGTTKLVMMEIAFLSNVSTCTEWNRHS